MLRIKKEVVDHQRRICVDPIRAGSVVNARNFYVEGSNRRAFAKAKRR